MNRLKNILLCTLILFGFSTLYAGSGERRCQTYENGFAVFMTSGTFPIGAAYYLGKNNNWALHVGVSPYTRTLNLEGLAGQDPYNTAVGAGAAFLQPIAKNVTQNKLFLTTGPNWIQKFGQSNFDAKIKSSWGLLWSAGLEYRFTPNFYLGMGTPIMSYSETRYETPKTTVFQTDTTEKTWGFASSASVYIVFKI